MRLQRKRSSHVVARFALVAAACEAYEGGFALWRLQLASEPESGRRYSVCRIEATHTTPPPPTRIIFQKFPLVGHLEATGGFTWPRPAWNLAGAHLRSRSRSRRLPLLCVGANVTLTVNWICLSLSLDRLAGDLSEIAALGCGRSSNRSRRPRRVASSPQRPGGRPNDWPVSLVIVVVAESNSGLSFFRWLTTNDLSPGRRRVCTSAARRPLRCLRADIGKRPIGGGSAQMAAAKFGEPTSSSDIVGDILLFLMHDFRSLAC